MKDLALLVADKNMEFALRGILNRPKALRIRPESQGIREWLAERGYRFDGNQKPVRPKEALN
jgi:hypothetical protein